MRSRTVVLSPSASVSTSIFSTTRRLVTTRALGENPTNPFEEDILAAERKLADEMFKFLRWWQREITASIHRNDPSYQLQQIQARGKDISMVMQDNFVWSTAHEQFNSRFSNLTETMMRDGVMQAQQLVSNVNFQLADATTAALSRQYMNQWWTALSGSTRTQMRDAFTRSMTEGWTQTRLRQELTPLFGRARAEVIATTETTRLYALGNLTGYSAAGIEQVEWRTARDDHVCPICVPLHGERFTVSMVCGPNVTQFKDLLLRLKEGCGFEMTSVPRPDLTKMSLEERRQWWTAVNVDRSKEGYYDTLEKIYAFNGDKKPNLVSSSQLDKLIASGKQVHYRGVTDSDFAEQFLNGTHFGGKGVWGNGSYSAYGSERHAALGYTRGDDPRSKGLIRFVRKDDAKVARLADAQAANAVLNAQRLEARANGTITAIDEEIFDALNDPGHLLAAQGFDGLEIADDGFFIVYNRNALIADSKVWSRAEIADIDP